MKLLRLCLLVALALLLPLRGVSAAALPCLQQQERAAPAEAAPALHQVDHADHAHEHHPVQGDPAAHGDHADAGGKSLGKTSGKAHGNGLGKGPHCLSSGSAMPLASAVPTLPAAPLAGTVAFAKLPAPAASFEPGRLDRPPRRS